MLSIRAGKGLLCNAVTYPPNLVEKLFGKSQWVPNPGSEGRQKGTKNARSVAYCRQRYTILDEFLVKRVHH